MRTKTTITVSLKKSEVWPTVPEQTHSEFLRNLWQAFVCKNLVLCCVRFSTGGRISQLTVCSVLEKHLVFRFHVENQPYKHLYKR